MATNGNPYQWGKTNPSLSLLVQDIDKRQLYVVEANGKPCAAFVLAFGTEPTYSTLSMGRGFPMLLTQPSIAWLAMAASTAFLSRSCSFALYAARTCAPIPMPTTRSCSAYCTRRALGAQGRSMWLTARRGWHMSVCQSRGWSNSFNIRWHVLPIKTEQR